MSKILILLASAFDTKGYPDDKNPENWRKINGAPVHLDNDGNIDGGAGGKFAGKQWNSSKHPHKPKPVTKADLDGAWQKVVKYKNAMNQAKTQKTYEKHAKNMTGALEAYKKIASKAPISMQKHNVANMEKHASKPYNNASPLEVLAGEGMKSTNLNTEKNANLDKISKAGKIACLYFFEKTYFPVPFDKQMKMIAEAYDAGFTPENVDKLSAHEKQLLAADLEITVAELPLLMNQVDMYKKNQVKHDLKTAKMNAKITSMPTMEPLKVLAEASVFTKFETASCDAWGKISQLFAAEADHVLFSGLSKVWKAATLAQKKAAYRYTENYSPFNEPLRGIDYGTSKYLGPGNIDLESVGTSGYGSFKKGEVKKMINDFTEVIDKCELPQDMVLGRGCGWKGMDKFFNVPLSVLKNATDEQLQSMVGKTVVDHGFMSTGCSIGKGFTTTPVQLKIYAPKGTKGMYMEPFSAYGGKAGAEWNGDPTFEVIGSEQEVVLQRSTKLKILSIKRDGHKLRVEAQVIAQEPQPLD